MQTSHAKAPISAHPLFPAVVAVWFAALFGLGCGVLPNSLFEHAMSVTGISSLIPSATPPLGATFRIALSLTFSLVGAALGFVLARKLAAAQHVDRPVSAVARLSPRADPMAQGDVKRRPISVKHDLGDTRLDPIAPQESAPSSQIPGRRRALAMAEDGRGSDFFTHVPLPATGDQPVPQEQAMEQPLDLASFTPPRPEPAGNPVHVPSVEPRVEPESIVARGLQGLRNRSPFGKALGDEGEQPLDPGLAALAVSDAGEQVRGNGPLPSVPAAHTLEPAQAIEPVAEPASEPKQVFAAAAEVSEVLLPTDPGADLGDLGMVALAERLGASLRKRRPRPASTPDFVSALKAGFGIETQAGEMPAGIAPAGAILGEVALDTAGPGAPPPAIPEALRPLPLEFAEDGEDDPVPSLSLPLSGLSAAAPLDEAAEDEDEFDDIGEAEENYSSLLAMNNNVRAPAEFVRVDEPEQPEAGAIEPAVSEARAETFTRPFDAPPNPLSERRKTDSEETARALRSALATLQRMRGAA